ncbi:hypothetical protein PR002_g11665 [Phytophthora rubi]|uniref:Uncharacterized protein n=1 Tax=Phytophthora rubi TaxID=129364 RepID=A0A6A3M5R7_9STRA|nr:hypothetical protein PR002_g11665 [Phytophthora rubi]
MDGGVHALVVNVHFVAALAIAALLSTVSTGNDDRLDTATRESEKGFQRQKQEEVPAEGQEIAEAAAAEEGGPRAAAPLQGAPVARQQAEQMGAQAGRGGVCFRVKKAAGSCCPRAWASEVTVVDPVKINVFAEIAGMYIVPATKWNAAARATGMVFEDNTQESVERRRETLELAGKNFPSEDFAKSTVSLLVPLEVEFLTLSTHRDFVFEEFMEHLGCIEEK